MRKSPIKELLKLKKLRDVGLVSEEEFERLKTSILEGEDVELPAPPDASLRGVETSEERKQQGMEQPTNAIHYLLLGFVVGMLIMLGLGLYFAVEYSSPYEPYNGNTMLTYLEGGVFGLQNMFSFLPFIEKPELVVVPGSGMIVVEGVDEEHGLISVRVVLELMNNAKSVVIPAGHARLMLENNITRESVFAREPVPHLEPLERVKLSFSFVLDGSLEELDHYHVEQLVMVIGGNQFLVSLNGEVFERVYPTKSAQRGGGNETVYTVGGLIFSVRGSYLTSTITAADGSTLTPRENMTYLVVRFNVSNIGKTSAMLSPIDGSFVKVEGITYGPTEQNYLLPSSIALARTIDPMSSTEGIVVYTVPKTTKRATVLWRVRGQMLRWDVIPLASDSVSK